MKPRASSYDVAELAGVSQSAVSRAFTPGAPVSPKMRARIEHAAATLGYRPNALARGLVTRRSGIVALVNGQFDNPFYARATQLLVEALDARGYHVLLFSVADDAAADAAVERVLDYRVDGVLLASAALSAPMAEACRRLGTPVLLFNRYSAAGVGSVRIENRAGGALAAGHLVAAGHRRIAYLAGTAVDRTNRDREEGFRTALAHEGLEPVSRAEGGYRYEGGSAALEAILSASARPTAIFCASDLMAMGAIDAARYRFGLSVPGDLAIVGFDDLPIAAWPSYDLTTLRQPLARMASLAVERLLATIDDPARAAAPDLVVPELVVRGSAPMARR